MPSPFYNLSARLKLRMLTGASSVHDIGVGFQSLGADIDAVLAKSTSLFRQMTVSGAANSGDFVVGLGTINITSPAAVANNAFTVFAGSGAVVTVTAASGLIFGDFEGGVASVKLTQFQHVTLQSDGTNWVIMAGEPKREQAWSAKTAFKTGSSESGEASATRPALVCLSIVVPPKAAAAVAISGVTVLEMTAGTEGVVIPVTLPLNPGQKWEGTSTSGAAEWSHSYLIQ